MKSYRKELWFEVPTRRAFINITRDVQHNVKTLQERGFKFIGPEEGRLACGTEGIGRMSEPQQILETIEKIASNIKKRKV